MRELVRAAGLLLVLVSVVTSQDCTIGEARLVNIYNGDTNRGLVQVCYNGGWNIVCGRNGWGTNSANVVCRQLGYSEYGATWSWLYNRNTPISFSGVTQYAYLVSSCGGDERVLTDCILVSSSPYNCNYAVQGSNNDGYYYATVTCQPNTCTESEIRLVNGTSYREGRVEVCVDGRWGTVCGEGWTNEHAGHVCTRLGYPSTGATKISFGEGTGPVYDIQCQQGASDECVPTVVTRTECAEHIGVRCKSYNEVYEDEFNEECEAEINKTLSSLTTPPPVECPTTVSMDCPTPPAPTMETTAPPVECPTTVTIECPPPTTMEVTTPVPCQCTTQTQYPTLSTTSSTNNITATPTVSSEEVTNSGTTNTLGALLGLLGVTLAAVLVGWIMTCVYCHQRINKQTKDHTHPDSRSDPALQLNNPVYDTSAPPPHTTYSSLGPSYGNNQGAGHNYDVITRPHPPTTLPGPPEHEYGVLEGPAHTSGGGVVEGTYSLVGESDPQDYEIPTPTTEGGQDYSKLQH